MSISEQPKYQYYAKMHASGGSDPNLENDATLPFFRPRMGVLNLVHEMMHAFGAKHDPELKEDPRCTPEDKVRTAGNLNLPPYSKIKSSLVITDLFYWEFQSLP